MTTDESSLTDIMSEDEVELEIAKEPSTSAQKAYEYLVPAIAECNAKMNRIMLPKEERDEWKTVTSASPKSYKVAIVGRTGAGKSTLLNALLHKQVLSTSASGACTAVVTEISYQKGNVEALVEFITEEEWRKTLCRLIEDATDNTVDTEEGPADNSKIPLGQQARMKILGVYPHLESVHASKWTVQDLLNDPVVHKYLGTKSSFSAKTSANFQKELEQFLASALSSGDSRALWPLVRIVKIMGPFPVLATGITLVDLPGYGDVDNTRDAAAEQYMISANAIVLVSPILRAQDDRDVHATLHKLLSDIIRDGRIQQKSILLVLTGTDSPIFPNEIKVSRENQEIVDALEKEAADLSVAIKDLKSKKERREKSRRKIKPEVIKDLTDRITEKRAQKDAKVREKNRILALERSKNVTKSLQKTYQTLYCNMSGKEDAPPIPVFCIGSRDFLCATDLVQDSPAIFEDPHETQIPMLRRYIQDDGERRSLTDVIIPMTDFCKFLLRFSNPSADSRSKIREIEQIINGVQEACQKELQDLLDEIESKYDSLLAKVKEAVKDAEKQSPEVVQNKESLKWNQYRSMMRRHGSHEGGNLNTDLTKDILPKVQTQWFSTVNNDIPIAITNTFCANVKKLLEKAVEDICLHTTQSAEFLHKSLGIESFITQLRSSFINLTANAQRRGSRGWEGEVKSGMKLHYDTVAEEKGAGMYKRMKLANREYIQNNAPELFEGMNAKTKKIFDDTVSEIARDDRLSKFVKAMRCLPRQDVVSPESSALKAAKKVVRDLAETHMDQAAAMLDDLKQRLSEITSIL